MFPSHKAELGALARQLLACLDQYEADMERLEQSRWDPELYSTTTRYFEEMKNYANAIPQLSGCWVELLISRFEFSAHLWASHQSQKRASTRILHQRHTIAIRALRAMTLQVLPRSD